MKTALLFSGQGAQTVGMAKSLFDAYDSVKKLFERADSVLGFKLSEICFEGPASELTKTSVCQPALYVHGMAVLEILRQKGILENLSAALGLSLGELTAHAAAGTYDFETGLKIVAERGRLMQEACDASKGAMASFIGGTPEDVKALCGEFDIDISNLNCPGQIVVSGEADKVAKAVEAAKGGKFKMVVPLKVAGAYHSRLMEPARAAFEEYLKDIDFQIPSIPVFSNVSGEATSDPQTIKSNLVKQIVNTVRWEDCLRNAAKLGIDQFYECGPGGIIANMCKRIDKAIKVCPISEAQDIAQ